MQQNYTKEAECDGSLVIPALGERAAEADCPEFRATLGCIIRPHLKKKSKKTKNAKNSHILLFICFVLFESRAHVA